MEKREAAGFVFMEKSLWNRTRLNWNLRIVFWGRFPFCLVIHLFFYRKYNAIFLLCLPDIIILLLYIIIFKITIILIGKK